MNMEHRIERILWTKINKVWLNYLSPEESYQQSAAFGDNVSINIVSLLSPWILGFDFGYSAQKLKLENVDILNKKIVVSLKAT